MPKVILTGFRLPYTLRLCALRSRLPGSTRPIFKLVIVYSVCRGLANLGQCGQAIVLIRTARAIDRSKGVLQQAAFAAALYNQAKSLFPCLSGLPKVIRPTA